MSAEIDSQRRDRGPGTGSLSVVGIGPGGAAHRTAAAVATLQAATCIAGYTPYVASIEDLLSPDQERIVSGMRGEVERCGQALAAAAAGHRVALVSSGDAGVYGMAGLALEMAEAQGLTFDIDMVPGVTAASAAGAALGAPLMLDFAVMSLSDLLVPWEKILARLNAVAAADLCCALYNPRSRKRVHQLEDCVAAFTTHRGPDCACGAVTNAGCDDQHVVLCTLGTLLEQEIGMRTCVIIGDTTTRVINGRLVTPRGYQVQSEAAQNIG